MPPFRVIWIAWAVIALAVAIPLALSRGHPPGLVFVPFVAVAWLVGHLLILAVGRLARHLAATRPQIVAAAGARPTAQWIAGGLIAIALLGATAFVLFMAGSVFIKHERTGIHGAIVIAAALGVWAVLAVLLAGLVARHVWAVPAVRWALAGAGLLFAWMVVAGALDELPAIAAAGVCGVALTGWLIFALRSRATTTAGTASTRAWRPRIADAKHPAMAESPART